jgi:hypothetical protein
MTMAIPGENENMALGSARKTMENRTMMKLLSTHLLTLPPLIAEGITRR